MTLNIKSNMNKSTVQLSFLQHYKVLPFHILPRLIIIKMHEINNSMKKQLYDIIALLESISSGFLLRFDFN